MHKNVLVTGGTGSFGKAFVDRLLQTDVERVVVYSRDELKQSQMRARVNDGRVRFFIGNVCNRDRLARAMHGVDLVVHAAAMKQVDTCENNPEECGETNIDGTQAVIDAALFCEVPRAIFLSTDKAAAPNTTYGASKLFAERLWTRSNVYAAGRPTRFSATRYGNVLGSRGSVVEVWRKQLADGVTRTVTDPAMSRFWMTIGDAVDLVLLAAREMRGGEVFVPKVKGSPVLTLLEAAEDRRNQPVKYTGIRRGEKLHEILISEHEARHTYDHGDHYRIEPDRTWDDTAEDVGAVRVPEVIEDWSGATLYTDPWSLRSDTCEQLTEAELREMIG